jgi:hypothetical protein
MQVASALHAAAKSASVPTVGAPYVEEHSTESVHEYAFALTSGTHETRRIKRKTG